MTSLWLDRALEKLWPPVQLWVHYPDSEGKRAKADLLDAYDSLGPREKAAYDADVAAAFFQAHKSDHVIAYRRRKASFEPMAGLSMSTLKPGAKSDAYNVSVGDVLVHWGQAEMPLSSRAYGHEKEIILRRDAEPVQIESNPTGQHNPIRKPYVFLTNCLDWRSGQDINDMKAEADKLTRRQFLRLVEPSGMRQKERELGYELDPRFGLTMTADRHVSYHRSIFIGIPCAYFVWSGIEHIFVEPDMYPNKTVLRNPVKKPDQGRIVEILSVIDTREYEEVADDVFKPIAGSGHENECERCGRMHEVHAYVRLESGETAVVGTGCMRGESVEVTKAVTKAANAAKRLGRLKAEYKKLTEELAAWDEAWARVLALTPPEPVRKQHRYQKDQTVVEIGDACLWLKDLHGREPGAKDMEMLVSLWRQHQMSGYIHRNRYSIEAELKEVEKRIRKLIPAPQL